MNDQQYTEVLNLLKQIIATQEANGRVQGLEIESLKRELALANALVASKDETISLLRIRFDRPN